MSLESVFAKTPPFVVGFHKKDSGMEDKERSSNTSGSSSTLSDNDDGEVSENEIHSDSDDGPTKVESLASTLSLNGMITETPSNEDVASKEDLEDGELEEGEIDSDEDTVENADVTEDIADPEPPKRSPEQLEKIPPLLLNLKNIARHEPQAEEEGGGGSGAEGSPSGGSTNEEEQAHAAHKKKKKKKKQKKKRKREEKEMKKKKKKYVDHDQVEEYPVELDDPKASWSGNFHGSTEFFRSTSSKHRPSNPPDCSPPGPYDSPYDSPPGPYDSPSDDDEFGPPPKLQRYDNEKGRYRANKKASMLSLLEDGYMDAEDDNEKELFDPKHKKSEKPKYYRDQQKQRESRDGGAAKQQRPICKFYKDGKCAKGSTCQFSHDVRQQHRPEICKFYLNSVCSKGDSCFFMHGTFPCRFFHAAGGCIHGDNCRFSHEKLTEETRHILERVLTEKMEEKANSLQDCSSSPRKKPSLLGSPPRQVKKIPSLFDIKVFPPIQPQRMKSPSQGSGPMSPPPRGMGHGFYSDIRQSPNRMPPPIRPNMMMPPPGMMPPRGMMPPDVNREGLLPHPGLLAPGGQAMYFNDEQQGTGSRSPFFGGMAGTDSDKSPSGADDGALAGQTDPSEVDSKYNIPVHLAPKQRELVLRIQQKQRERDASVPVHQNTNGEEAENDNWYSSDEEDAPKPSAVPPNILQNLGLPPGSAPTQQAANQQPSALNIAQMLNVIRNSVTAQPPPAMGDGQLGGMNAARDPRVMMSQPSSDPRTGPPHASPKTHDPRLHSATSNMTSSQLDASITVDASLAQSGGGVPYVVRRHPSIPQPSLPTSVNMFDAQHAHDPRVQKLVKKLEPSLIHQEIVKGDAGATQRMIPLMGEHDIVVAKPAPALPPPPQLTLPPLLQNMVLSGVLPPDALQQMVRFPPQPRLPPPRLPQHRFQQPPPNILAAAAIATMSHVRLGRTMSQPPPCEPAVDPRFHRRDSNPVRRDSNPAPEKVIDPRVSRIHEARSQDSAGTSPNAAAEMRLTKALSAPVIPAALPQLLKIPPPPLHPGLKPAMTDPRTCKSQGGGSASSSGDDQGDSPQHVTQHADAHRPLLSHRNDPRFKKRNKAVADTPPSQPENSVAEPEPINPPPLPQRRGMEYSSPLGGNVSETTTDTSAGNAYNRPPNSRFQQLQQQQHQKHHFKHPTPDNGKTTTTLQTTTSLVPSQLAPVVTDATLELTPEQLQLHLGAMGDEPSLKDMFKTFDPTASPFC